MIRSESKSAIKVFGPFLRILSMVCWLTIPGRSANAEWHMAVLLTAATVSTVTTTSAGGPNGATLFATYCSCHTPAEKSNRTSVQIREAIAAVDEMGVLAALSDAQISAIADYLQVPVRILETGNAYPGLQWAYNAAASGNTIAAQAAVFTEDLLFDHAVSVALKGGYDESFGKQLFYTQVQGSLTIRAGTVTLENIIVK